jgi:uncharacterized membrane protein YeaQ/YmgE (transglycosylase-associated protein family)
MKGVVLGLVVGIFGNLVAQYFSSVIEGTILGKFDNLFYLSTLVFSASLLVVISIVLYYQRKVRKEEQHHHSMWEAEKNVVRLTEDLKLY